LASAIVGQWDQAGPGERGDELGGGGPRDAGAARKVGCGMTKPEVRAD
jgi:hypothetical protein